MATELTDEEVFELSDEDVFGDSKTEPFQLAFDPLRDARARQLDDPTQDPEFGSSGFLESAAADPKGFAKSLPGSALSLITAPGRLAYAGAADVISKIPDFEMEDGQAVERNTNAEFGGNLKAMSEGKPLPVDKFLAAVSKTNPRLATAGKIGQSAAGMAPLAAIGMLPAAAARLATAGFTVDMVLHAPAQFEAYAEEINKPPEEQNPDKLTTLQSDIIQTFAFAPLAGMHASNPLGAKSPGGVGPREVLPLAKALPNVLTTPIGQLGRGKTLTTKPERPLDAPAQTEAQAPVLKEVKTPDSDWQVSVQAEQGGIPGSGFVQIDSIAGGKNNWSKSQATLAKEGYTVPDFSKLPQGKYSYAEAVKMLDEKPLNPGGALKDLPPELQKKSNAVQDAMRAEFEKLKQQTAKPAQPLALVTDKTASPIESVLAKEFQRLRDEERGKQILETLDEEGRTPNQVVDDFWKETYPNLPAEIQKKFHSYIKKETGFEPGSVIATGPNKERITAKDWSETYSSKDAPNEARYLEGTERGLITLMEIANRNRQRISTPKELTGAVSFLDRASETEGLSRPSTMPTVADVRAQRASEKVEPALEVESTTPLDPATGKPVGVADNAKMRRFSERGTVAEMVPKPVQEQIKTAPESFYTPQKVADVKTQVRQMPDADLAAVPKESNIKTAAVVEQVKRLFESGKNDAGYSVFQEWSAELTRMGQVVNQAKLLTELQPEHLVTVVNKDLRTGGYDPLTKPQEARVLDVSKKKEAAQRELDKATDAWVREPTDANAKLAEQAHKSAEDTALNVQRELNKFNIKSWPKMLKAFAQGNPLTPISQVANIVGNTLGAAMEAGSRTVGAQMDMIRAALTGGERKLAVSPVRGTAEAAKGFGRGLSKAPDIMAKGAGETIKGETRAQLQPLKAWSRAFAKHPDVPTKGGKVTFNDRAKSAVEAVFGLPPETMLRLLSAADKPAYESAFARLVNEQAKLQKLPSSDLSMAQKFPELFFDQKTLRRIQDEASDAIFQRQSKTVSYLTQLIKEKTGDWGDFAFTLLVAPYRLTPWNLVGRTLMYNPLIAAARVGIDVAKGNTRQAEINAGRMIVGGIIYTAGIYLYKNQLIGPSLDDRDETQKARLLSGEVLPPNHVNIDGLKRLTRGGDPKYRAGDETMDLTRGGGAAGSILSTVANIGRDFEKKPQTGEMEFVGALLQNSTLEQASFTVNQSFLKGVTGVLDAVRNRNIQPYIDSVESMLLNVPTPNTLSSLSRATRKYMPDLSADTFAERAKNIIKNRFGVAGYDDYLATKRDLWGEKMEQTPEGRNALLYHLFDISKNKQVTDDPVSLELYDLWRRTADNSVIPSIPTRTVTVENKSYPLNAQQYEKLAETVGRARRMIVDRLVINPKWQDLPDEGKIKILETAYRKGADFGKQRVVSEIFGELEEKPAKAGFSAP